MSRTFLIHLNIELPDDTVLTPDTAAEQIEAALQEATRSGKYRVLNSGEGCIPLAEEV